MRSLDARHYWDDTLSLGSLYGKYNYQFESGYGANGSGRGNPRSALNYTAKALFQYRSRNDIELHFFYDMKNLMVCKRIRFHSDDVMQGRIFINSLSMFVVKGLKQCLSAIPGRERKYWKHQMILHKVATYSRIHYKGKYKDAFSVPTTSQRLIFDLFDSKYDWKAKMVHDEGEVVPIDVALDA